MTQRRIGILGYDGMQALDLVGPAEAFAAVRGRSDQARDRAAAPVYEIVIIGLTGKRIVAETGLTLQADTTSSMSMRLDTVIIPGGRAMRDPETSKRAAAWITSRAAGIRRIASVCTGIYGLAPTGLLDGRRVTTHLTACMAGHLSSDLSVEAMAAKTFLCTRQFSRVFKQSYGTSPATFVEELRLAEASRRLTSRRVSVDWVARSVGYRSVDVFRRAFERRYSVSPSSYRSRFATGDEQPPRKFNGRGRVRGS